MNTDVGVGTDRLPAAVLMLGVKTVTGNVVLLELTTGWVKMEPGAVAGGAGVTEAAGSVAGAAGSVMGAAGATGGCCGSGVTVGAGVVS